MEEEQFKDDYIYSTVPDEAIDPKFEEERHLVLNFLKKNPGRFFKAANIAREIGFPTKGTQVEVRKAVTQLIEIDGEPLISNAKGFAYALQPNQLRFYADRLEERKQGLQRRIDKVREIYDRYKHLEVIK